MVRTSSPFLRKRSGMPWKGIILVLVFSIALTGATVWRSHLEGLAWSLMAPLERTRAGWETSEVTRLRAELASTTARMADRDALYEENLQLKRLLGRDAHLSRILAGVLLRPPGVPYDTLIVDAGAAEGVREGSLVSAGGTALIGSVTQVYEHTSRVVLFSAPGETYDVLLQLSGTEGTVVPVHMQGQGAGSFMGQVPAGTPVATGDALVFPGIASQFAGQVSHVIAREGESFQTLYARLPTDPLSLQFVEIIQTYAQE